MARKGNDGSAGKGTKQEPAFVMKFPCEYGGVSIGDTTARIGVRVPRGFLNLVAADEALVGHRLDLVARLNRKGADPKQLNLLDDIEDTITGSADVKRIGVNQEQISFGLTFSLADVDISELAKFSKGNGEIQIDQVAALPSDSPADGDGDDADA